MFHSGQLPMSNGIYANPVFGDRFHLFDPARRVYLHFSGTGETTETAWAWSGRIGQAQRMRALFFARNLPFPFELKHPVTGDLFEVPAPVLPPVR